MRKKLREHLIGVISDTHGLMRPEALRALENVELILHAGDVGDPDVLSELAKIARIVAIRGNVDRGPWAKFLPHHESVEIGSVSIFMIHDLNELDESEVVGHYQVVISGHSHKPLIEEREGVIFLNPGSAGPRRFRLPISLATLRINGNKVRAELCQL